MILAQNHSEDGKGVREAILDAAEQIMREEGYAAVSSRKVALRAGLKSQLAHYYFKTMDELFLALFHRIEERHFARLEAALASKRPLHAFWAASIDKSGPRLTHEFMAFATHRGGLRVEIARSAERTRAMLSEAIERSLSGKGAPKLDCPPMVLAVLMAGAARLLIQEAPLAIGLGHSDTLQFVEGQLARIEPI